MCIFYALGTHYLENTPFMCHIFTIGCQLDQIFGFLVEKLEFFGKKSIFWLPWQPFSFERTDHAHSLSLGTAYLNLQIQVVKRLPL